MLSFHFVMRYIFATGIMSGFFISEMNLIPCIYTIIIILKNSFPAFQYLSFLELRMTEKKGRRWYIQIMQQKYPRKCALTSFEVLLAFLLLLLLFSAEMQTQISGLMHDGTSSSCRSPPSTPSPLPSHHPTLSPFLFPLDFRIPLLPSLVLPLLSPSHSSFLPLFLLTLSSPFSPFSIHFLFLSFPLFIFALLSHHSCCPFLLPSFLSPFYPLYIFSLHLPFFHSHSSF